MDITTIFEKAGPYLGFLIITLIAFRFMWKWWDKRELKHEEEKAKMSHKHEEELKAQRERYDAVIKRIDTEKSELAKENKELYERQIQVVSKSQEILGQVLPYLQEKGE